MLDETTLCEPMTLKVLNKTNEKFKFLYRKNKYLTKELRRMLCNALIQSQFDCACPTWYSNLDEKTKMKVEITQNKCIRIPGIRLKLEKMYHISEKLFRLITWLTTSKRVDQCINTITYNFVNKTCPRYLN